jgi:hypothetical protein
MMGSDERSLKPEVEHVTREENIGARVCTGFHTGSLCLTYAHKRELNMAAEAEARALRAELRSQWNLRDNKPGELWSHEVFWRDHQPWLEQAGAGYALRPRYHQDWVPSWKQNKKYWERCEDGQISTVSKVL